MPLIKTYVGMFCFIFHELLDLLRRPVEGADDVPVVVQVQNQVLAHHCQPDHSNVSPWKHMLISIMLFQ